MTDRTPAHGILPMLPPTPIERGKLLLRLTRKLVTQRAEIKATEREISRVVDSLMDTGA